MADWHLWLASGLTLAVLLCLAVTRLAPHLVMIGAVSLLSISGVLTAQEALAGFANPGVITVAAMFVVAAGIYSSGGIDLLVRVFLGHPQSERGAQVRISLPVVFLSAFLNNTPVVATLIPALAAWGKKIQIPPSKLMIPLSYAAILGGTITIIGTSTNLAVDGQYRALTGAPGFSIFSITLIGLPVAIVGVAFMLWWFPRALPNRRDETPFGQLKEFTLEVAVAHDGPLVGKTVGQAGLRGLQKVYLVEIEREGAIVTAVPSEEKLKGGDRLVFAGETDAITDLLRINGIVPSTLDERPLIAEAHLERSLVEAVISPHSDCIGETIRNSRFRERYGAVVLAVARNGERVPGNLGNIRMNAGDTLLLEARPAFVSRQRYNKDFLLVNDLNTQQPRHQRAYLSWCILLCIVLLAALNVTDMLNAALLGAIAMVVSGCCSVGQAEKSLDFRVILTIACSFALSAALHKTGATLMLAHPVINWSGGNGLVLLILVYVTVSILTEVITNNAAAILMVPIVLEITTKSSLPAEPYMFAIMMAASASFATPIGYQTNLMVYGPGGYRYSDFLKVGVPMNIVVGMATVATITLLYGL